MKNRLWPMNLYKGIFWNYTPKFVYLGVQDQWYSYNMFDAPFLLYRYRD